MIIGGARDVGEPRGHAAIICGDRRQTDTACDLEHLGRRRLPRTPSFSVHRGKALNFSIFVILLERDAARHRHVYENIMPRLPSARIVRATDYRSGGIAGWLADNKIIVDRSNYTTVADSKLACTISHLRVWQTIANERIPHAIVLEDDVEILDDFEIQLDRIKSRLSDGCDFVHLYVHRNFQDEFAIQKARSNDPLVRFVPPYGLSAYLLSGKGASKLAAEFRTVHDH
ncbi:MAG: glycosyltransferase family 25 protein, partial [Proteobacteria bacterium]|nr:glycosyltransferase family 25 protein [Pseudomonadota bacterium]